MLRVPDLRDNREADSPDFEASALPISAPPNLGRLWRVVSWSTCQDGGSYLLRGLGTDFLNVPLKC
jgi:hypothetical protein